jgi:NAD(P)-dependent dehydrogenase (short-subunit alcohol dehydrogenase family)
MNKPLQDQVALITGGAQGLGAALANTLGSAGATVIVADLNRERAVAYAQTLKEQDRQALALYLDVRDVAQAREALDTVTTTYGSIDILINNAGIDRTTSIVELDFAEWDDIMATNLRGPFVLSKLVLPLMQRQGHGQIVNIVSTAAKRAWANAAAYHASKWGLLGFSHALHVEARAQGIKVSAVISGGMRTPFLLERFPDIPLATLQDPANVAQAVLGLLTLPPETVVPEITVLPLGETSWP